MTLFKKWWFPLFGVPAVSYLILAIAYLGLHPVLTYDTWRVGMGSLHAVYLIVVATAMILPWIHAKLFRVSSTFLLVCWSLLTGIGFLTIPREFNGNQTVGLTAHFIFNCQLPAVLITAVYCAYQRKKTLSVPGTAAQMTRL